jgi:hypothetical protein
MLYTFVFSYTILDDNSRSNYKARELKSIHIDCEAEFIKLVIKDCYVNELNLYNQVCLAISFPSLALCASNEDILGGLGRFDGRRRRTRPHHCRRGSAAQSYKYRRGTFTITFS